MMVNQWRIIGLFIAGVFLALALALAPSGNTAVAQTCDPSGSQNGSAQPSTVLPGQQVLYTGTGFQGGENVSFWFTLPTGDVFGTASPLCCAAPDGSVRLPFPSLPGAFYDIPGKWAITFQGATSQHTAVIYFCVLRELQATAT